MRSTYYAFGLIISIIAGAGNTFLASAQEIEAGDWGAVTAKVYDPTFSRAVWRLYGGAKGLPALF